PLFVFRHRMSKQADTILGLYLYDGLFDTAELRRNFEFYQKTTLHHSSLSTCIFGLLACRIGDTPLAADYFTQSARMDLDDVHQNVYAGIHAANMAGSWLTVANGFGGLRTGSGQLCFAPQLPPNWEGYRFRVYWRGAVVECAVSKSGASYTLIEGAPVTFCHCGQTLQLQHKGECCHAEL
ncbi:MAG: glycosyl hydrolase family 65 protein, partial [Ruthenibacterium sp.]